MQNLSRFVEVGCVEATIEPVKAVEVVKVVEVLDFVDVRQHANCLLDHSSFLKKQQSPLCIRSGEETCWLLQ